MTEARVPAAARAPAITLESWRWAFVYLLLVFTARVVIENTLLPIEITKFVLLHEISFFFLAYSMFLVLFSALLPEEPPAKLVKYAAWVITLVLVGPLLDCFLFHRDHPYAYANPSAVWQNLTTFFAHSDNVGPGLRIQMALILAFATTLVLLRSRSATKAILCAVATYAGIQLLACPRLVLPIPDSFLRILPAYQKAERLAYFVFDVSGFLLAVGAAGWLRRRQLIVALARNTRPLRSLLFVLVALFGSKVADTLSNSYPAVVFSIAAALVVLLLWQSALILNDCSDVAIDIVNNKRRPLQLGVIGVADYRAVAGFLTAIAIATAFLLGAKALVLAVGWVVISVAYSFKPFYLKGGFLSYLAMGCCAALSFLIGAVSTRDSAITEMETLSSALLVLGWVSIVVIGKDYVDVKGDRQAGVRNLFVIFDPEKAKRVFSWLLLACFLAPAIVHSRILDMVFLCSLATVVFVLFRWKGRYEDVLKAACALIAYLIVVS